MAIGAVNALREAGIAVPGQVCVAGCDGLEFGAKYFPPLTTMEHPRLDLGAVATDRLRLLMNGQDVPAETVLPHRLVVRATSSSSTNRAP